MMTVAELIEELRQFDPSLPVVFAWGDRYANSEEAGVSLADWLDLFLSGQHGEVVLIEP